MSNSPYGPKDVRRVSFKRLPKAIREAGISMIERKLANILDGDSVFGGQVS
jgi:hypothetical protein